MRLAIFASGNGSNAQRIIEYFKDNSEIEIPLIITNKQDAFVRERAKQLEVTCVYCWKSDFYESNYVLDILQKEKIDWIILAGFLWLIPDNLLKHYPDHIVNIHPALLPKFGGKGMYGMKVHESVITAQENVSGITIHFVNEQYDEGKSIFQAQCDITSDDNPESLAAKIHELEYQYYPQVIEQLVLNKR